MNGMIAAIYARKSTEQNGVGDEEKSVVRQVEHARAYATRKGWSVADEHVYMEDGISGAEFVGHARRRGSAEFPGRFLARSGRHAVRAGCGCRGGSEGSQSKESCIRGQVAELG
ncbi:MAG: recombinase family protein [Acidobacteria bacterium]|nr:recombinase family protein [Acidobacteriota bacterium]